MKKALCAFAAAATLCSAASAQMVTATNPQTLVDALQSGGYKAQLAKDDAGDPRINSAVGGTNFVIFFYGCAKNVNCKTVQFFAGFSDMSKITLEQMNSWNTDFRWGRAYKTKEGAVRLEMDVDLEDGGVSRALFLDNIEYWETTLAAFEKHIGR